jgi:EAL and modified HD-GYP domain-containing signal transduction protein
MSHFMQAAAASNASHDEVFIGRQPIVDTQQRIIGYELLFREHADSTSAHISDDLLAGAQVIVNTLSNMGAEWLLGDKIAFMNVSAGVLQSDHIELLPARRMVLDLLEDVLPTPEVMERLQALKQLGFTLSLDRFDGNPERAPLLGMVDFVKIDLLHTPPQQLASLAALVKQHPVKLVAEKVETKAAFNTCMGLNFDLFQGFHFAHPETLTARVINPSQTLVLELLNQVRNNADVSEIEKGFKRDVALSFKLLRYINSVGFGLSCEIQSIKHALAILGYQQLYRWLTLLVVTANEGWTPPALMKTAITRGRLTELLGQDFLNKSERDNLFIVGIFSLLDAMLEMPMEQILEKILLPEPIAEALLHRDGVYGPFLQLAEACEGSNVEHIRALAESLTLDPERVNAAHLQALSWVEGLGI